MILQLGWSKPSIHPFIPGFDPSSQLTSRVTEVVDYAISLGLYVPCHTYKAFGVHCSWNEKGRCRRWWNFAIYMRGLHWCIFLIAAWHKLHVVLNSSCKLPKNCFLVFSTDILAATCHMTNSSILSNMFLVPTTQSNFHFFGEWESTNLTSCQSELSRQVTGWCLSMCGLMLMGT